MLTSSFIVQSLQALDAAYQNAPTADDAERAAKLAIIELCGWIEEAMDSLVLECANRKLTASRNVDYCKDQIIAPTYGFDYQKHFRSMLIRLVGIIAVEVLESQVDQATHASFKSTLGSLRVVRDRVAHTHLQGVTTTLDAPSVTSRSFHRVYDGLVDLDQTMRSSGW